MANPTYLTTEQLAESLFGIRDYVDNPKKPYVVDRAQMPFKSMLDKMASVVPFIRNNIFIKYKAAADELEMQTWYNKDRLRFQELREGFDLVFNGVQVHMGLQFWHQELKDSGFVIVPNTARSQNFAKGLGKVEALRLIDTLKEKVESALDQWDVLIDRKFLHNVSGAASEPAALSDFISKTPTVGLLGGRDRSDPLVQNQVFTASTSASFERDVNRLMREAARYNRGFKGAGINVIQASAGWIDRYSDSVRTPASFQVNANVTKQGPVDIGIPDTQWGFNGVKIIHNPTMDEMANLTGDATWNRRAYGMNSLTWRFGHGEREDKELSFPSDPSDQRFTLFSLDGRYVLHPLNVRSNFVHEFAS